MNDIVIHKKIHSNIIKKKWIASYCFIKVIVLVEISIFYNYLITVNPGTDILNPIS